VTSVPQMQSKECANCKCPLGSEVNYCDRCQSIVCARCWDKNRADQSGFGYGSPFGGTHGTTRNDMVFCGGDCRGFMCGECGKDYLIDYQQECDKCVELGHQCGDCLKRFSERVWSFTCSQCKES